jgi:uncharacterized protein
VPLDVGPLLDLQAHDSGADRLRVRLASMPEQQRVEELESELRRGESALAQVAATARDARHAQDRLEVELDVLEKKVISVTDRLYGRAGVVSSPKELQALQADLDMLNRQKGELEERVIAAMEQREETADLEKRTGEAVAQVRARLTEAQAASLQARTSTEAELDKALVAARELRLAIPADVLGLYDSIRGSREDGVAAAALSAGVCGGCKLRLSSAEYERARHTSELVRCEACRRILVVV